MVQYQDLSKEQQEHHDQFCSDITKALQGLQRAAEGIVEMLDATTNIFSDEKQHDDLKEVKL